MSYTIPQAIPLMSDETAYSFYLRVAAANGLDMQTFSNAVFPARENGAAYRFVRYDIHDDGYRFLHMAGVDNVSARDFYLATSLFPGVAPLMTKAVASRHIGMLSLYRHPSTTLIPAANDMITELRYCPQCMADSAYYRRSHQMPGVTACYIHGCRLLPYQGERGQEMGIGAFDCSAVEPADETEISFAVFAHDFLFADLQCDISDIRTAVRSKIRDMDEGGHDAYREVPDGAFLRKFISRNSSHVDGAAALRLLYSLFGSVDALTAFLPPLPRTPVLAEYALLSPYRPDVIEVRCKTCGTPFLTTPYRLKSGWGCPTCDGAITDAAMFSRLVRASVGLDYELLTPYTSMTKSVTLRHTVCGRIYDAKPRAIMEDKKLCPCGCASEDEVRRRVEASGQYRLASFDPHNGYAEITHELCGRAFFTTYKKFFLHPHCPTCSKYDRTELSVRRAIADVVGDEYELVKYNPIDRTAVIRHTHCGEEQSYTVSKFLDGVRCHICRQRLKYADVITFVSAYSRGEYRVVRRVNPDTVIIHHTPDGRERTAMMRYVIQEFLRPTPSKTLPIQNPDRNVSLPMSPGNAVMAWIRETRADGTAFTASDVSVPNMDSAQISRTLNNLNRAGRLIRVSYGAYKISPDNGGTK